MLMKIIIFINLFLALIMTMLKSPISSNLLILIQSINLSLTINLMNKTSWISYMIFILYIGGLMIIFLYISSIAFNEFNMMKNYINLIKNLLINLFMFILLTKFKYIFENLNFENNFFFEDNFYFINMFNLPNYLMIYFIILILFFMLILIIWLLKFNKGPIRQKL